MAFFFFLLILDIGIFVSDTLMGHRAEDHDSAVRKTILSGTERAAIFIPRILDLGS